MRHLSTTRALRFAALALVLTCLAGGPGAITRSSANSPRRLRDAGAAPTSPPVSSRPQEVDQSGIRQVSVPANDLVVDPNTHIVYASVPSSAGAQGNSITPIDPVAGTTGQPVPIGSEPDKMAISGDGQFIYVALRGEGAVRRFDVATQTGGLEFPLGNDPLFGAPLRARDIEVAPGNPHTVAVALTNPSSSPSAKGVVVFDDGVARPRASADADQPTFIEYSGTPDIIYGVALDASAQFNFRKMAVGPCGVSVVGSTQSLSDQRLFAQDIKFDNGLLYMPSGRVFDPEAMAVVRSFDGLPFFGGLVLPDSKAGRVYFLFPSDTLPNTASLRVYDINTTQLLGGLDFPGINSNDIFRGLVRWGSDGLAFSDGHNVYLVQNSLIGGISPAFVPAPTPPTPTITLHGKVTDFRDGSGVADVTVSVSGTLTTSVSTDAGGNYEIRGVGTCDQVTLTPARPAYAFTPQSASVSNTTTAPALNFTAFPNLIRFPVSTFPSISEGAKMVQISVTRTGDLSFPASVDYETQDGTASARSDYTAAYGTLNFAPGQSLKTIRLLLTDDALVEGTETFTLALKNPVGVPLDPSNSTLTISIFDNDSATSGTNPTEDPTFFVRQHYHDFLNREPDASGLQFWTNGITSCGSDANCIAVKRVDTSAAFFLSIEFQQTGYLVERIYKTAFGDATGNSTLGGAHQLSVPVVRLSEFLRDTQEVGSTPNQIVVGQGNWQQQLEDNKNAFALEFVQRQRFATAFPSSMTADEFVNQLNANAGGVLTASDISQLDAVFGGAAASSADEAKRAQVLRQMAENTTLQQREFDRAFVLMQYFGYLRRNPNDAPDADYTGYDFWLSKLNQFGGDYAQAEMVKAFISSDEYRKRFGQ
jgi:hypothetical protein